MEAQMTTVSDIKSHEKVLTQVTAGRFVLGLALSALSGVLLLLSFPPYGVWWLAWFAFVPGIFAQYRMFPRNYAHLAPTTYALVWLGPYMARLFGTEFGPFFTYLGVLIAIIIFF
jgi:apolipoprotein N-acyltransferase